MLDGQGERWTKSPRQPAEHRPSPAAPLLGREGLEPSTLRRRFRGTALETRAAKGQLPPSGVALEGAPIEWIEREIGELAAHIAAAMCRWLELVAEFDRRAGHEARGFHSCGAWVAWRCSIDPRSAREHVRVARSLCDLALIRERFGRGELSYSKVRAMTRIATAELEEELVEMARFATAAQLERLVRGYRRSVSRESAEALHSERFLSHHWDEDGCLCVRGKLSPEDGALFLKALEAGRGSIRKHSQGGSAEPGPVRAAPVNNADALMEVAECSLACGSSPRPAGERHQVVIHADAKALSGDGEQAGCRLDDGPAVCAETARRLACDASLVSILHGMGGVLDVGRKTRAIPPSMRRALDVRVDGGLVFRRPDGRAIPPVPSSARGRPGEVQARNRLAGLRIGAETAVPLGRGEPMDEDLAVTGLLTRAGPYK